MLISGELYQALKDAGACNEKSMAAAALLASQELRLQRLEEMFTWALRGAALIGASAFVSVIFVVIAR
jgi:hypothetical protein